MQLRPRCGECRSANHIVCPEVVFISSTVVKKPRRMLTTQTIRCCSFCGITGHYKPKCEKYKVFVDEVKPSESDGIMITVLDAFLKDMQNMFCRFIKSQFNPTVIFGASNDAFRLFVKIFLDSFAEHMAEPSHQSHQSHQSHHNYKIALEFCKETSRSKKDTKPCCAFCRADVKKVSVGSKTMLAKLKKNKKFSV